MSTVASPQLCKESGQLEIHYKDSKNKDDVIPLWRKVMFASGAIPYAMCNTVVGFYLTIFLQEVAFLDPIYVMIIVFTGRVWDAITDPAVGYLTSRTKTRFGRLRPWMMTAAPIACVMYFALWFVPDQFVSEGFSEPGKFVYYIFAYYIFQSLLTCIHVPYTSLTMHLSSDPKQRDSATLYRIAFEVAGTLLGIGLFTAFYKAIVGNDEDNCSGEIREPDERKRKAYLAQGVTLGVLIVVFIAVTFIGVREQKEEIAKDKKIGFFRGWREVLGVKAYRHLLLLELFSWLSVQFVQGNFALYVKYSVGLEDQYPYVIAVLLVATILWMPVWQVVLIKFGKKTAFFWGLWLFTIPLLILLYVDYAPYLVYPLSVLGGLGVAACYLIPWSMLPDVIDESVLQLGVRREELFYACFVFGVKFSSGISLGISTAIYTIAGYDKDSCDQSGEVLLTFKLLVSAPPILFILISMIFLHLYPITSESVQKTKTLLQQLKDGAPVLDDGSEYVSRGRRISNKEQPIDDASTSLLDSKKSYSEVL